MNDSEIDEMANMIVHAIIADIRDRRGLKQEWNQIDSDIKDEIYENWKQIVTSEFRKTK